MDIVSNFHDDLLRPELVDLSLTDLQELLERCVLEEEFEIARVVKLEIDSRV